MLLLTILGGFALSKVHCFDIPSFHGERKVEKLELYTVHGCNRLGMSLSLSWQYSSSLSLPGDLERRALRLNHGMCGEALRMNLLNLAQEQMLHAKRRVRAADELEAVGALRTPDPRCVGIGAARKICYLKGRSPRI